MNFKSLQSNKNKNINALTQKFSKLGKYVTTKICFQKLKKNNVFLNRYNKNYFRSVTCYSYTIRIFM